jgi:uncharacterized protein CbrC (UPF0167 family)
MFIIPRGFPNHPHPLDSGSIASDTASIVTGTKLDIISNFAPVAIYDHDSRKRYP